MDIFQQLSWVIIGQIILIDILLGGDNAIVIALACRHLPAEVRMKGIVYGTAGAIFIRILLISFAVTLLTLPYLKLIGGFLLLWIGVKLLTEEDDDASDINGGDRLSTAIKTIIVADLAMSIDNVIAVASAAEQAQADHKLVLVIFGILISIPVVVWGSSVVLKIMDKVPAVVTGGSALLGYLGGEMIVTDAAIHAKVTQLLPLSALDFPALDVRLSLSGIIGALLVLAGGWWISQKPASKEADRVQHETEMN
jgi:YjbE family integral membrane protein